MAWAAQFQVPRNTQVEYLGVVAWAAQFQVPSKPQHVEYLGVMAWETHKPNNVVFGVDFKWNVYLVNLF